MPDHPDHRDVYFGAPLRAQLPVIAMVPSEFLPPVWDQGDIGSCTAHAVGAVEEFVRRKDYLGARLPSRLFLYYEARRAINPHWVLVDTGASIRAAMKVTAKFGLPDDRYWPYIQNKFAVAPPQMAYINAERYQTLVYGRVPQSLPAFKASIVDGYPIAFGCSVYQSFMEAKGGVIPLPHSQEPMLGGHAMVITAYDDNASVFTVRNSWGKKWGYEGYCTMPYAYLLDSTLSSDFWTMRKVEG